MVITIIALACFAAGVAGGFFAAIYALKTGLKWQMQTQSGEKPTIAEPTHKPAKAQPIIAPDLWREIMTGEVTNAGIKQ